MQIMTKKQVTKLMTKMMTKLKSVIVPMLIMVFIFTGCGAGASDSVSMEKVTMADEIAGEISENAIPAEAYVYSSLSFNAPEGMVPDKDNTETKSFYLSEATNDLSFVGYQRRDNTGKISYDTMSLDDFKAAFVDQLGVEPIVNRFIKEVKDGYFKIDIGVCYSVAGINYTCTEYIFVTDAYIFSVTYCQDARSNWLNAYKESAEGIMLVSVVDSIKDKDMPGEIVEDMNATDDEENAEENNDNNENNNEEDNMQETETVSDNAE